MKSILFLCTGNSCRSQMAEAFAKAKAPAGVRVFSAGTNPAGVHPRTKAVMNELGFDLTGHYSKDLSGVPVEELDTVVTLCGNAAESCPRFPRPTARMHWALPDPARVQGSESEVFRAFRSVRDEIEVRVEHLLKNSGGTDAELIDSELAYTGKFMTLQRDTLKLPNGTVTSLEILRHPGASAVAPLLDDGRVVLIRQYRHAAGGYIFELPAGKLDPGETPEACAHRETIEEAGYEAGRLHRLGPILTTPGFTDEIIYLFAATDLKAVPAHTEADEVIEVHPIQLPRALEMVASGEIKDGKTICALFRLDQELRAGRLSGN